MSTQITISNICSRLPERHKSQGRGRLIRMLPSSGVPRSAKRVVGVGAVRARVEAEKARAAVAMVAGVAIAAAVAAIAAV